MPEQQLADHVGQLGLEKVDAGRDGTGGGIEDA